MEALNNTDKIIQNCNIQTLDTSGKWYTPRARERELDHVENETPTHIVSPDFAQDIDNSDAKLTPRELKRYSSAILHEITFGNSNAGENRLLKEIYWRTIGLLARTRTPGKLIQPEANKERADSYALG